MVSILNELIPYSLMHILKYTSRVVLANIKINPRRSNMSKRYYKSENHEVEIREEFARLPIDHPIAVYYRQSTDAQIGNISTTLQTVDMVSHLKQRGWKDDSIIMIDMDAGISGTTKIDERPGMKHLF